MSEFFFTKLNRIRNFKKHQGVVEVYAVINPSFVNKNFIGMFGTLPLTPCVVDNTNLKFVIQGEKVFHIKTFNFIPSFIIDNSLYFKTFFPFPKEYVISKLNKKEKESLKKELEACNTNDFEFFQGYRSYER